MTTLLKKYTPNKNIGHKHTHFLLILTNKTFVHPKKSSIEMIPLAR